MSASEGSRRAFACGSARACRRQGVARRALPGSAETPMDIPRSCPARRFAFPADHGPHPEFRIEWWYVTANLKDADGAGLRRAMDAVPAGLEAGRATKAGPSQQVWMGHAAVTSADTIARRDVRPRRHRPGRRETAPFRAWIDDWRCAASRRRRRNVAALELTRLTARISATSCADADRPLVLQGDKASAGSPNVARHRTITASRSSRRPARIEIDGKTDHVTGRPGSTASGAASRWPPTRTVGTGSRCISTAAKS